MIRQLGIPYMGSKRKLAPRILDSILERHPTCEHIYDLFGGGGAFSLYAIQHPQIKTVHYNDFDAGIVNLMKKLLTDGVTAEFYEWVSRETFHEHRLDESLYGGFLKTCWSFGSNHRQYIYGKHIEEYKHLAHNAVIFKDIESLKAIHENIDLSIIDSDDMHTRRLKLKTWCRLNKLPRRVEHLTNIQCLERLQHLEHIERLQHLEHIDKNQPATSGLQITNLSYADVLINHDVDNTIIYCDPPYKNTAQYSVNLNHDEFYDFVNNSKYTIYVSSYESPLHLVESWDHREIMSKYNNKVKENLYCNKIIPHGTQLLY